VGPLASLLSARLLSTEVIFRAGRSGVPATPEGARARETPEGHAIELPEGADVDGFLSAALAAGASVLSVSPRKESLEDLFLREARGGAQAGVASAGGEARA
jgi:hypothetical protein